MRVIPSGLIVGLPAAEMIACGVRTGQSEASGSTFQTREENSWRCDTDGLRSEHTHAHTQADETLVLIMIPVWNEMSEVPRGEECRTSFRSASTAASAAA